MPLLTPFSTGQKARVRIFFSAMGMGAQLGQCVLGGVHLSLISRFNTHVDTGALIRFRDNTSLMQDDVIQFGVIQCNLIQFIF